jgi:hypothetical protein
MEKALNPKGTTLGVKEVLIKALELMALSSLKD